MQQRSQQLLAREQLAQVALPVLDVPRSDGGRDALQVVQQFLLINGLFQVPVRLD